MGPVGVAHAATAAAATGAAPLGVGQGLADFYAARPGVSLWFDFGRPGRQIDLLLAHLASARIDGLDPERYLLHDLHRAVAAARNGNARAVRRAETMLSQALVSLVRDMRRPGDLGIDYVDVELRPGPPSPRAILEAAARAPSVADHVGRLGWMNPVYGQLRDALVGGAFAGTGERERLMLNLERARALPAGPQRHVLVNVAQQRLYMVENGKPVDSMRVVVGKPKHPTPMMAAYIRFTSLNPYWNVPPDLAAERIAPFVVRQGLSFLKEKGYEVLSDWSDSPSIIDPATIDWKAVADGRVEVRVRQLPGPSNAMGRMKFMFPNAQGIYLHDTPDDQLFSEASRLFSGGCVRLEDAPRLAAWLYGESLQATSSAPEQKVPLPHPVPVYLTYLTAMPEGAQVAFFDDIYGRDAARLAQLRGSPAAIVAGGR